MEVVYNAGRVVYRGIISTADHLIDVCKLCPFTRVFDCAR